MLNPIAICADRNPFKTVEGLVSTVAKLGFQRIEWFEVEKELWTEPAMAGQLRALMKRHEVSAQYHAPYERTFDLACAGDRPRTSQEVAEVVEKCLARAERLGAPMMTLHLGSCPAGADRAEALRTVMEGIRQALPEIERRRVRVALENHTSAIIASALGDRPEELDWVMESLPSEWIGLTLDVGHAHINGHLNEFLLRPLDRVFNLHLHDNLGQKDEHLPIGHGSIPWGKVFSRLRSECCRGVLTFEFYASAEDYRASMDILRPYFS